MFAYKAGLVYTPSLDRDVVRGAQATLEAGVVLGTDKYGVSVTTATERGVTFGSGVPKPLSGGDWTALALARPAPSYNTAYTAAFSQRRTSPNKQCGFLFNSNGVNPSSGSGRIEVFAFDGTDIPFCTSTSASVVDGEWHAFVGRMSGAIGRLYLDGAILSSTQTFTSIGNWYDSAQEVTIGRLGGAYEAGRSTPFALVAVWDRALSDAEVAEISANPWQLFRADPIRIYSLPSGGAAELVIASASHAHTADAITLSAALTLAADSVLHSHTADATMLSAALNPAVQDALHGHAADNVTLVASDEANLDIASAAHSHFAEALILSSAHTLVAQGAAHVHTVEAVALSAALNLLVDAAIHAHLADNATLDASAAASLSIDSANHAHLADALTLSGALTLIAQSVSHAHNSGTPTLSAVHTLAVQDAAHAHLAETLSLNTGFALTIANAFHAHIADGLGLDTALSLAINDALHAHATEAVSLTAALTLIVADTLHDHYASNVGIYIPAPAADLLRRSVFVRLAGERPFVRVETHPVFVRVQ